MDDKYRFKCPYPSLSNHHTGWFALQFNYYANEPLSTNRGLKNQIFNFTTNPDCISVVVDMIPGIGAVRSLLSLVENTYQERIEFHEDTAVKNGCWWSGYGKGALRGIMVYYNESNVNDYAKLMITLPGGCLSRVDYEVTRQMLKKLTRTGFMVSCSRFDAALDDYDKLISFEDVRSAVEAGNYSRFTKYEIVLSGGSENDEIGWTIYLGSRKSEKRVRFYNKTVESGGEKDCYRWEVQFRKFKANQAFHGWLSAENPEKYLASLVTGSVDFLDRSSGDNHVDRLPRLDWWVDFVDFTVEGVRIACKKVVPSLEKSVRWFEGGGPASLLAMVSESHPEQWLDMLLNSIEEAKGRFSPMHRAKIQLFKDEQLLF